MIKSNQKDNSVPLLKVKVLDNKRCGDKYFKVGHLNINRLYNKTCDINLLLKQNELDILCLTETWLDKTCSNNELFLLNNFITTRIDRHGNGGGIVILSKSE